MDHIYKPIRTENHKGDLLEVCRDCFGCGVSRKSSDQYVLPSGRVIGKDCPIDEATAKSFKKKQWKFTVEECKRCGGTGMAKVAS